MNIVGIGAGNVASHLFPALQLAGHHLLQICGKRVSTTRTLASELNVPFTCDLSEVNRTADVLIICVPDDAISRVAEQIGGKANLVVHTSGSTALDALRPFVGHCGVLYPFQTFSKDRPLDMKKVPILIEGNNPVALDRISELAKSIADHVEEMNSRQRLFLHIAAVYSCNFTNFMITQAYDILRQCQLSPGLLRQLISETCEKALAFEPAAVQTGPAVRGDRQTLGKHLEALAGDKSKAELYQVLSDQITKYYHEKQG